MRKNWTIASALVIVGYLVAIAVPTVKLWQHHVRSRSEEFEEFANMTAYKNISNMTAYKNMTATYKNIST